MSDYTKTSKLGLFQTHTRRHRPSVLCPIFETWRLVTLLNISRLRYCENMLARLGRTLSMSYGHALNLGDTATVTDHGVLGHEIRLIGSYHATNEVYTSSICDFRA